MTWLAIVVVLVAATGCKTTEIPQYQPIPVPAGMTEEQVELAILITLAGTRKHAFDPTGLDLDAMEMVKLLRVGETSGRREFWRLVYRAPGRIEAQFFRKRHSVYMDFDYDRDAIRPRLAGSVKLNQSEHRIHKNASRWIEIFLERMQYYLVTVESMR